MNRLVKPFGFIKINITILLIYKSKHSLAFTGKKILFFIKGDVEFHERDVTSEIPRWLLPLVSLQMVGPELVD